MAPEMMTTKNKFLKKQSILTIIFISLLTPVFASTDETKWTIAAQKFEYSRGQKKDSVSSSTAEMIPLGILEKIGKSLERNVLPDERFERQRYQLRTERQSLYLQLNSEYSKRDTLLLNDYSESKLKAEIQKQNKRIQEIKEKINQNLEKLKEAELETDEKMNLVSIGEYEKSKNDDEKPKLFSFFKQIFEKDDSIITLENISFYNDGENLYTPSEENIEAGYLSYKMEKALYSAGINTLITGKISNYDDYISVSVDVYLYPGAKLIGSVMEIGSVEDLDFITSSLANQIIPLLTNSMPVNIEYSIFPEVAADDCSIYVDDVLQKTESNKIIMESGVHTIQFVAKGYKTVDASYYFEGNKNYAVEVNFKEIKDGYIQIGIVKPVLGDIFVNGEQALKINDSKSQIKINGQKVLGEFLAEDGTSAYFYVPENLYKDGNYLTLKPKPFDREKYIDTRRKWMYGSYSAFIVSLIPYFYCYGNFVNKTKLYNQNQISFDEAKRWQTASNVTAGISIGLGVFWGVELVRYLLAANSVLPQKAKEGDIFEFEYVDPESLKLVEEEATDDIILKSEITEDVEK